MKKLSMLLKNIYPDANKYESLAVQSITNDSREVIKGALFLAYPGFSVDGRDYITQAIENGAVAICYDPNAFVLSVRTDIPCIAIENLKAQEALIAARFYDFSSEKIPVIGVTGTNGKTSVTHFVAQALEKPCVLIGTAGYGFLPHLKKSLNTTPDGVRLQKMIAECVSDGAQYLVMEVSSHALVEKRMAHVQFHTAVFTNLSREHLDFHKTMGDYRDAKAQLFQQPGLKNAIINIDDPVGDFMIQSAPGNVNIYTYSTQLNAQADIVATNFYSTKSGLFATIKTPWGSGDVEIGLFGEFNLQNCLAVVGVLGVLGMSFDTILQRISQLGPPPGRMTVYHQSNFPTVAIDYAHTPDALEKALKALRNHCEGKLWCVFGCGGERDHGKRAQMGAIAAQLSDRVVITNDNPRGESPESIANDILSGIKDEAVSDVVLDRAQAIENTIEKADSDDVVLVAGKGHETTQTIGDRVMPFSDVDVVLKRMNG